MSGVSFSNQSQLSSVVAQIGNASAKQAVKNDAQVRLTTSSEAGGVTIYEAKTKGSDSSLSATKLAGALSKIGVHSAKLDAKVEAHGAKLDNWNVFEGLARNELASGLAKAGQDSSPARVDSLLKDILQDVRSDKNYNAGEVRFGPLAHLSQAVKDEVAFHAGNNPLYGSHGAVGDEAAYGAIAGEPTYDAIGGEAIYDSVQAVRSEALYTSVNKGAGNREGAPIVDRFAADEQKNAARTLSDIDQQVYDEENSYSSLTFRSDNGSEPGSFLLDETYSSLDQAQVNARWEQKVDPVNNESIYANSEVESVVENSEHYSEVLFGDNASASGSEVSRDKPAPLPKPAYLKSTASTS